MNLDRDRLWSTLEEINSHGALDTGGVERLAWTQPEVDVREWLARKCEGIGLETEQDETGNVWALGQERPAIVLGSHLDTVPNGGRFDGALGIAAALEALTAARAARAPGFERLGLVCFTDEEGVRFGLGMTGSRAVAGGLSVEDVKGATTTEGKTLYDVLREAGLDPERVAEAGKRRDQIAAYLELHVEQGRRLERAGLPVAIVSGIVGLGHWRVEVAGEANHAGTTLPDDRRDALIPVAAAALEAQRAMRSQDGLVSTMGEVEVVGGATNIVPGRVRATLDVRSLDESLIEDAATRILGAARDAAADNGCEIDATRTKRLRAAPMADEARAALTAASSELNLNAPEMPSMAGHDSMTLTAGGVKCGMVFVRSRDGISHSPQEYSAPDDCLTGAQLIADAALRLADGG